ncbi:MAG: hypothetical protein KIT60_25975 [Burkholderiaceae bacterium]|nr:hypothetical protein [Burkholderiaceae bacterium]
MASNFVRGLLLLVLGLGVAGFGICSLCGGVLGISALSEGRLVPFESHNLFYRDERAATLQRLRAELDTFHAGRRVTRLVPAERDGTRPGVEAAG